MRNLIVVFSMLLLLVCLSACSNEEVVSLEPIQDRSTIDIHWIEGLDKGVYFKKISTTEGILYVNLNTGENNYTSVEASVKHSSDKVKILIKEVDVVQDTEVGYEYYGKLTSKEGLDEIEGYLNGEKEKIIVIK